MARAATKEKTTPAPAEMADGANAGKEMTVSNGASGPMTVAQENKAKLQKVLGELAKRADDYRPLLTAHNIPWEVFTAVIQQALIKVPFTLKCTTASILSACMRAAADGLFPDGDECALVPFKNTQSNTYEATYVPGYKGMLKCAYAMQDGTGAKVYQDVDVDVIYEGEEGHFKVRKGTDPSLTFEPPLNRDINKPVIGAYAVVRTNNGGIFVEVVGQMELGKIASVSKAKNGPREKWGAEMHKKGPLRRLLKRTPKDQRLARLMSHDEEAYLPDAVSLVDGDHAIPDDKLFDDTAHQIEAPDRPEDHVGDATDMVDPREAALAQARADLMDSDTEAKLDATLASIRKATEVFTAADIETLLQNGQQLRLARFGANEADRERAKARIGDLPSHPVVPVEVVGETVHDMKEVMASFHDDVQDADFVQAGHEEDDLRDPPVTGAMDPDSDRPRTEAEIAATPRPTETAPAPSAASRPASSASATAASTASPAASSLSPASSNSPSGGWKEAPADRRMTPAQALLEGGVHFKRNVNVNGHGQVPMFSDETDEIVGWAKPDLDIPTRPLADAPAAARGGEAQASSPSQKPSDTSTTATTAAPAGGANSASPSEPQVRTNPEDRQEAVIEAQTDAADEDDDYGDEEGEEPAAAVVYLLKARKADPPKEYTDPTAWKDDIIFRMSSLKDSAIPIWWEDNRAHIEAALKTAPVQAGKVVLQCVVRKLAGAQALVEQYGPFGR